MVPHDLTLSLGIEPRLPSYTEGVLHITLREPIKKYNNTITWDLLRALPLH